MSKIDHAGMEDWNLPWDGGCRCGQVRLKVTKPPLLTGACHCTGCQTMSASAYSLTLTVPADGFEVTKGEPVLGGLKSAGSHHYPLPRLHQLDVHPRRGLRLVRQSAPVRRSTSMAGSRPCSKSGRARSCPGPRHRAKHSYESTPEIADWQMLIQAYAAEGARPQRALRRSLTISPPLITTSTFSSARTLASGSPDTATMSP